jgi:hypothetical protein
MGLNFLVVTLKAKLETCIERDRKRDKPLGKKAVEEVFALVSQFDSGLTIEMETKKRDRVVEEIQEELLTLEDSQ